MNAIIIIVKSVNLCTQLRSSFGMYELRYGNLQKTFYRDNFRSLLYAAISHITHHALRRYLNRHNEMHFLCLTKKLNLKMIFIVGIKKIDNTNCYIIHYQQQQKREFRMCIKKYDECICPDQWVYYNVLKLQTLAAATGKINTTWFLTVDRNVIISFHFLFNFSQHALKIFYIFGSETNVTLFLSRKDVVSNIVSLQIFNTATISLKFYE